VPFIWLSHTRRITQRVLHLCPLGRKIRIDFRFVGRCNPAVRRAPLASAISLSILTNNILVCCANADGELLREWQLTSPVRTSPALARDGTIYVSASSPNKAHVFAIAPEGPVKWQFTFDTLGSEDLVTAPAVAVDGTIYLGTESFEHGSFIALAPDGSKKWSFKAGGGVLGAPALSSNNEIYFASVDGSAYALDSAGHLRWQVAVGSSVYAPVVLSTDGAVYVSGAHKFYAFSTDGSVRWSLSSGLSQRQFAIASDGTIYGAEGSVRTFRIDGSLRWDSIQNANSPPSIGPEGELYFVNAPGTLVRLDLTGAFVWESVLGSEPIFAQPAISSDAVYIAGNHDLFAVNFAGKILWNYSLPTNALSAPVIAPDGIIYFGAEDGKLRAIYATAPPATSPWPMFQHDSSHSGRTDSAPTRAPSRPQDLTASVDQFNNRIALTWQSVEGAWYYELFRALGTNEPTLIRERQGGTNFFDTAVLEGVDYNYFLRAGNSLGVSPLSLPAAGRARIAVEGEIVSQSLSISPNTPPVLAPDGTIYLTSALGKVSALNSNLSEHWSASLSSSSPGCVLGEDRTLYVSGRPIQAYNSDGSVKWILAAVRNSSEYPLAIAPSGDIYAAAVDGFFFAIKPDGNLRWTYAFTNNLQFRSSPLIGTNGTIYVRTSDLALNALSPDGSLIWSVPLTNASTIDAAIGADGSLYFTREARGPLARVGLHATTSSGSPKWTFNGGGAGDAITSDPVVAPDGSIIFGSTDEFVYSVNPDGSLKWKFKAGGYVRAAPEIAEDGTVFFGTASFSPSRRSLFAVSPEGSLLWTGEGNVSGVTTSPMLLPDHRLLVIFGNGSTGLITAFRTFHTPARNSWSTPGANHQRNRRARAVLSRPRLTPASFQNELVVTVDSLLPTQYGLEWTTDLRRWFDSDALFREQQGSSSWNIPTDSDSKRFFRLRIEP
jgi:hypothetical protein